MSPITALENFGHFAHFALRSLLALPAALVRPREAGRQLYAVLLGAMPLGVTAGLAIGVVIWMHLRSAMLTGPVGREALRFLPMAVALAVVLEFAPMAAGLIVAGRAGASLGAELGAMRLTEQIDALEVLGRPAERQLIGPRVLACVLTLPILTVFIAVLALASAFAAEMIAGTLSATHYE